MQDYLKYSVLFDYYGSMLSENQQMICDMYFNQNLSLSEIAEDIGITKQGVRDALKKSEHIMENFEDNLRIKEKNEQIEKLVLKIEALVSEEEISEQKKKEIYKYSDSIKDLI